MDMRPIGVFDSGLGGLTAVRSLREILPEEERRPGQRDPFEIRAAGCPFFADV